MTLSFPALKTDATVFPARGDENSPARQFRFAVRAMALHRGAAEFIHESGRKPAAMREGSGALRWFIDRSVALRAESRGPMDFNVAALENELHGALVAVCSGEPNYAAGQHFANVAGGRQFFNASVVFTTSKHHDAWSDALGAIGARVIMDVVTPDHPRART